MSNGHAGTSIDRQMDGHGQAEIYELPLNLHGSKGKEGQPTSMIKPRARDKKATHLAPFWYRS